MTLTRRHQPVYGKNLLPSGHFWLTALTFLLIGLVLLPGHPVMATSPPPAQVTLLPDRVIAPPELNGQIHLTGYSVQTRIQNQVATTTITQTYHNASSRILEARYLFPLPTDAHFSSLTLTVNGQPLEGTVMAKDEARQTYQDIVRRLVDPALLEYVDRQTVQLSVAPFRPGERKEVRLSYTQLLQQDGGLYKYTYHLGQPQPGQLHRRPPQPIRPHPQPIAQAARPDSQKTDLLSQTQPITPPNVELMLDIHTPKALKTIYSPTHTPQITRTGQHQAQAKLTLTPAHRRSADHRQFVLYFSQDNQAMTLNALHYKTHTSDDGYFLLTVRPPDNLKTEALPKDIVLALDTSGSMRGGKIEQAREALRFIINQLRPTDRFALIQFNTDVSSLNPGLVPASPANRQAALDYIDTLHASGGTHIEAALQTALGQLQKTNPARPAYVIFLTDGEPTVGVTQTAGLLNVAKAANQGQARLFSFGVGYNLNAQLLNRLSGLHRGSTTFVEPNENLEVALSGFYQKIASPILTQTQLQFEGMTVSRMYPETPGDLFAGSEILVLGRYTGQPSGHIQLTGQVGNQTQRYSLPVQWASHSTTHSQLPRLWAGRRVAHLLNHIQDHGENAELKDEIIALGKQFGLVTPYTSFLAQEPPSSGHPLGTSYHHPGVTDAYGIGMHDISTTTRPMPNSAPLAMGTGASVGSMASTNALRATHGQGAVQFSKQLNAMRDQQSLQALDEAQQTSTATLTRQTVGLKTFVRSDQNVWTDTQYNAQTHPQPIRIPFGSPAYFQLLSDLPELRAYLSLGEQVLVVYQPAPNAAPRVYQITAMDAH